MQLANVKAIVDERHLQSALPLLHSGRVKVPLMLHVAQVTVLQRTHACPGSCSLFQALFKLHLHTAYPVMQVASYTGAENANLQVHLEYAAVIDASNETIGRKTTLPVQLQFLPSLEVPVPSRSSMMRLYHTECVPGTTAHHHWPSTQACFCCR